MHRDDILIYESYVKTLREHDDNPDLEGSDDPKEVPATPEVKQEVPQTPEAPEEKVPELSDKEGILNYVANLKEVLQRNKEKGIRILQNLSQTDPTKFKAIEDLILQHLKNKPAEAPAATEEAPVTSAPEASKPKLEVPKPKF